MAFCGIHRIVFLLLPLAAAVPALAQSGSKAPPAAAGPGPAVGARDSMNRLLAQEAMAQALLHACDRQNPAGAPARGQLFAQWRREGGLEALEPALIAGFGRAGLREQRRSLARRAEAGTEQLLARTPVICDNFQAALAAPALALAGPVAAVRAALAGGADLPPGLRVVSIAQLSARALAILEARPPGQPDDRGTRRARERAAGQALAALGPVVARGHVEERGRVREWRGDERSAMALRCRRFAERHGEDALQAMEGREVVLTGTVTSAAGRLIFLTGCRLLPETVSLPPLPALTETGGLEPRPLTAAEANAGPGHGIASAEVDRVLYTARFRTMPDGLGNIYTDRGEQVYVLLRDGSAYRHEWSFPFSDLNLALSRRREPGRWLRWRQEGAAVLLQDREGRRIDLDRARALLPVAPGTRFDHHYYLLNVGLGGVRRDRAYTFRSDGTVTLSAANLVAANLGPSRFIAATRPGTQNLARYAFDGYVLSLTDAEGKTERRFVAQFEAPGNGVPPNDLVIGGEVHWTREEDRRRQ